MTKRSSIKDVAKEAGVSTATISYVLNNKSTETISPETIEKVNAAIKKLDYVPNLSARSLISKKSNMIGVLIPQTEPGKEFMFSNPFYGEFLSSVEYAARLEGYHVLISGTNSDQSYFHVAKNRVLDGIIIVGMYPDEFYEELKQIQIPIVMVDSYGNDHYFHSISNNDRYGGYLATNYLIRKGHKKIAFISGVLKENGVNFNRFLGYRDALSESHIDYNENLIYKGIVDFEYGIQSAAELLKRKNGETAIFATADILAAGVVKGFKQCNIRIPDDISIVGFDDIYLSQLCDPSLTTVKQNILQKGETAAKLIIQAAQDKLVGKRDIIIPIEMIERDSVRELK